MRPQQDRTEADSDPGQELIDVPVREEEQERDPGQHRGPHAVARHQPEDRVEDRGERERGGERERQHARRVELQVVHEEEERREDRQEHDVQGRRRIMARSAARA